MRTKVTLALLFLNVALFFFIIKFEVPWNVEQRAPQARTAILGPEAVESNIQSIRIVGAPPAAAVNLVRRTDGWYLTEPFEWPASRTAVNSITSNLQFLRRETDFSVRDLEKNGRSLADFGLSPPAITATINSVDPSLPRDREPAAARSFTIKLGSKTPDGNSFYLLSPNGETIYVVGRAIADSLSQTPADLRLDTLFTIADFEARSLSISPKSGTAVRLRREQDERWAFESPGTSRAERNATRQLINELGALRARDFVTTVSPEIADATPDRIALEGNGRGETLLLLAPTAPPVAGRDVEYYARMESKNTWFKVTIPAALHTRLFSAQTALRDRTVIDFDPRSVTRLTVSGANRELDFQRLEPATPTDTVSWRLVRTDAGGAGQSVTADADVVSGLLIRLMRLTALEFTSDAPTPRDLDSWGFRLPERTVRLTLAASPGVPATTLQMSLGVDTERRHAYVRVLPSESIYEVDPKILADIPVDPVAYRDRLLRTLPANAQISTFRITDLQDNKVLVDYPSAAATANPAVPALLAQLRTLRASSFVSEPFSESENPVEKRPWRYKVELTTGPAAEPLVLFLGSRAGGNTQYAGSPAFNLVWVPSQPLIDAFWALYPDPGPPPPAK